MISHSSADKIQLSDHTPEDVSPRSGIDEELFKFVKENSPNDDYVRLGEAAEIQVHKNKVREDITRRVNYSVACTSLCCCK